MSSLCVCHCCKTVALDISFFFPIAECLGLILMWNSLCLQSNMNLGCFEVMVGRGGPECAPTLWALKKGYQKRIKWKGKPHELLNSETVYFISCIIYPGLLII